MASRVTIPTLDEHFTAARDLAVLLRKALDDRGSVTRGELRKALRHYEQIDKQAANAKG
jgi:hypothetical protein